ncbi:MULTISPECIES: alpha/beta hydrolase [Acinetobacter]|jgi:alpha-beta hydrolase superfamily lysophospholipase|uniref:Alpha/beta hydrolase n=4 Tax=Acinetobacter TaxID=469 RepID=A0A2W5S193_ACIJO|nr:MULTISPECIES: alpha/beta hydrolase [Acinetobacter]MDA0776753.1 alpha/beta hydrolase [Pseudomonadota bacterium]MDN5542697.1 alpha/beta hydrolase [Acinetobacter sp.]OHC25507.1 MAG: lysophospholipase [Pseudomonadales bacterium RIFCSPHIGHO2_12_FULL_40_16]ALV72816.1 lysophospholipase [Acinetobacter johnsonii XBB1]AZN64216.1 lysophospholipase [Acinetobacter johnsonii]
MPELPFLNPSVLKQLELPVPSRETTPQLLMPLNLNQPYEASVEMVSYRRLYGLDALDCDHWQGYVQMPLFKLHVQVFAPKIEKIKGSVCLLHGYLEHSGIYQPIIKELLEQGFSVLTYDLPGHGLSDGSPANIQNFDHYQDVLHAVVRYVKHAEQLPQPWLGIGQSTGGAILMHHLLEFAERRENPYVQRVLLLSPLIRPAKSAWWHNSVGLGIIRRIKRQVPRHFRRNNHNPEFLRFVRLKDPLQPRMMGMDWILAMSKWMLEMEQRPACRIPVWLAQGALDQTVDWRYNIEFIREKFRLQTLLMLEEGSHQLINERSDIRAALTGLIPAFLHAQGSSSGYY